jgi:integration host factor subunit alpha
MNKKYRYCLTKADLAESIYAESYVEKDKSAKIVDDFFDLMKEALVDEGKVMFSGFGTWEVKAKPARRGRNPQTREAIMLRARKIVRFKTSNLLRAQINGEEVSGAGTE